LARDGANGCGLTVLGESGGGKSALLANWVARWRQAHPGDFVFQHYIGSSAMSAGHLALMRRLMAAIVRWCGADDPSGLRGLEEEENKIPAQAEEIVKVFPDYLNRLAAHAKRKGVGAILVFDALNQLEDRDRGRLLAWLPFRLPGELRLIVSTLPGDTFSALQPRGWPTLTVEPLTAEERVQLIARYLTHFAQGLSDARARKIAGVPAASNPLYIKTLLDDLRATGDHRSLDQQIADYLQAADIPALLGKILTRFERDYERDRPGLVREALSLLWAARRGLTEPELLEALKPAGQERLPAAVWSPVRCALEDGLVDRDGVLAFAHEHLRVAVERRYVSEAGPARALRLRLAEEFAGWSVGARQADELPWLLWQAESRDRLRACLLDIDRFLLIQKRDENELLGYWVWLKEERTMGRTYLDSFESWSGESDGENSRFGHAANRLALFLQAAALYPDAERLYRRALAIAQASHNPDDPIVAIRLNNLADLLRITNRMAEAEPFCRRVLAIDEQIFGKNHPNVARDLNNLAQLLTDTDRLAEGEVLMRRALAIWEQSLGENHPNVAMCLSNLALLLRATNRPAEAESLLRRALAINERSYGPNHPDVAIRLVNLALVFQTTNRLSEADPLLRRALAINEQTYGLNHPEVAINLSNLAALLQDTNRLAEAESLMRRALVINEQIYGPNHLEVGTNLNNLAWLLKNTDRLAEAEPLMRRHLEICVKFTAATRHEPQHLRAAIRNYAALLRQMGRSLADVQTQLTIIGKTFGMELRSPLNKPWWKLW
jgi:tetratricopeptide (TPR) repeat protein